MLVVFVTGAFVIRVGHRVLLTAVKHRRLRWAEHITRLAETGNA